MNSINNRSRKSLIIIVLIILFTYSIVKIMIPIFYPLEYLEEVEAAAAEFSLDPCLILAVIKEESGFDPLASSTAGAQGLMQLMPETSVWIAERMGLKADIKDKIWDAGMNIRMGAWYLDWLANSYYGGNQTVALAAYNAGIQNVDQWLEEGYWDGSEYSIGNIPYPETRKYLKDVLRSHFIYHKIYGNEIE